MDRLAEVLQQFAVIDTGAGLADQRGQFLEGHAGGAGMDRGHGAFMAGVAAYRCNRLDGYTMSDGWSMG